MEIYVFFQANARVSSCFKFYLPDRLIIRLGYLKDSNAAAYSVDTGIS